MTYSKSQTHKMLNNIYHTSPDEPTLYWHIEQYYNILTFRHGYIRNDLISSRIIDLLANSNRYLNRVFAARAKPSILRKEVIEKLSTDSSVAVQKALAQNTNVPLSSLKCLIENSVNNYRSSNTIVVKTLLSRSDITLELVKNLYNSKTADTCYISVILNNCNSTTDILEEMINTSKFCRALMRYITKQAPEHSNLRKDTFYKLMMQRETYDHVSYNIMASKNMTPQLFELFSNNYHNVTRRHVAHFLAAV